MRRTRLAAPLALLLLLTACGGGGDSEDPAASEQTSETQTADAAAEGEGGVKAAEDLFVGRPEVKPDAGGKSATLIVTTNKDVECKVVFGTTEDVSDGEATDTDMGEDGHKTHKAVMTGLKPDTEYHYRVVGSDADGTEYESELATFRTSSEGSLQRPGKNVAVDADVADFSSEFSETFQAGNAIDGDPATEWSTSGDGDDATITLDLGRIVSLVGVGFQTRSMSDGSAIIETFQVIGDDGKKHGPYSLTSGLTVVKLKLRTRTLRFEAVKTTGGNTGAVEIEAYEAPAKKS